MKKTLLLITVGFLGVAACSPTTTQEAKPEDELTVQKIVGKNGVSFLVRLDAQDRFLKIDRRDDRYTVSYFLKGELVLSHVPSAPDQPEELLLSDLASEEFTIYHLDADGNFIVAEADRHKEVRAMFDGWEQAWDGAFEHKDATRAIEEFEQLEKNLEAK